MSQKQAAFDKAMECLKSGPGTSDYALSIHQLLRLVPHFAPLTQKLHQELFDLLTSDQKMKSYPLFSVLSLSAEELLAVLPLMFKQKNGESAFTAMKLLASQLVIPEEAYDKAIPMLIARFKGSREWGYRQQYIAAILLSNIQIPSKFLKELFDCIFSGISSCTINPKCIKALLSKGLLSEEQKKSFVDTALQKKESWSLSASHVCELFSSFDLPFDSLPAIVVLLAKWKKENVYFLQIQTLLSHLAIPYMGTDFKDCKYGTVQQKLYLEHHNSLDETFVALKKNLLDKNHKEIKASKFSFVPEGCKAPIPKKILTLLLPLLKDDDYYLVVQILELLIKMDIPDECVDTVQKDLIEALKKNINYWEALIVLRKLPLSSSTQVELVPLLIKIISEINGAVPAYHAAALLAEIARSSKTQIIAPELLSCLDKPQNHDKIRHIFSALTPMNLLQTKWNDKLTEYLSHEDCHIRANCVVLLGKQNLSMEQVQKFMGIFSNMLQNKHELPFVIEEICKVFVKWHNKCDESLFEQWVLPSLFQAARPWISNNWAPIFYQTLTHIIVQSANLDKKVQLMTRVELLLEEEEAKGKISHPVWTNFSEDCQETFNDDDWLLEVDEICSTVDLSGFIR